MKRSVVVCVLMLMVLFSLLTVRDVLSKNYYYLDPDIEKRIQNQHDRIEAGINSGQLTRDEARTLKNNLHYIQNEAIALQSDGRLASSEKQRLNSLLDRNSEMIREKRQNPISNIWPGAGVERDHQIQDIIARQQARINSGIRTGQLTEREAKILNRNLNQNSRMIQNKKTNPINDFGQVYDESNPAAFRIDQRIHNQQNRIDQGVRAGSLTREEARILRSNLKYIMEQSRGIKKDGVITNAERRRLNALLDENSNMIQDKKTNPIRQTW